MECASCGATNSIGSRFCTRCGAALRSTCSSCGALAAAGDVFCTSCGLKLAVSEPLARSGEARRAGADGTESNVERRFLSVMFCDLADSTELAARFDPEELREIIDRFRTTCTQVFEQFGGYVADFLGDGILIYFGYPQSHENDAERAVLAGLRTADAVAALSASLSAMKVSLAVRIGIASGLVVAGDLIHRGVRDRHAIIGQTPNLAARLQSIAERGTVVIADDTKALIRGLFELEDLGAHALKGFVRQVHAWRVLDKRMSVTRFKAAHEDELPPLIGRQSEFAALHALWQRSKTGKGQVCLIVGEPGIGKSRLTQELSSTVESGSDTATVLQYSASPYGQNSVLLPFIAGLEQALSFTRADTVETKWSKLRNYLRHLSGESPEAPSLLASLLALSSDAPGPGLSLSPQDQKERTMEVLSDLVVVEAALRPVLAVFEDAHWFDPSSLDLVRRIADATRSLPVLILVTSRPDSAPQLRASPDVLRLTLGRFTRAEAEVMLNQLVGANGLASSLREEILEKTDGVPLFIEELTRMVLETTSSQPRDVDASESTAANIAIPATLLGSMNSRLDGLGFAKEAAQVAAVIGREFSSGLLKFVLDASEIDVQDALAQLVAAGILQRKRDTTEATYVFRHALLQSAAYEALLIKKRQALHRKIAEVLELHFPDIPGKQPDLLARHFTNGLRPEKALQYWRSAGFRAAGMSANPEAAAHFKRALRLLPNITDDARHDQLELELQAAFASVMLSAGSYAAPDALAAHRRVAELCDKLGDGKHTFHAIFGQWLLVSGRSELGQARGLARRLMRIASAEHNPSMMSLATHASGMSAFSSGEFDKARVALLHALELEAIPHQVWQADFQFRNRLPLAINYLSLALFVLGYPDQAFSYLNRMSESIGQARDPYIEVIALTNACYLHQFRGDFTAVVQNAAMVLTLAEEKHFTVFATIARIFGSWAQARQGQPIESGEELVQGLASMRESGALEDLSYYHGLVAEILAPDGYGEQAVDLLTQAIADSERTTERWYLAELYRLRGVLRGGEAADQMQRRKDLDAALAIARSQNARAWELRAAISLCRLGVEDEVSDEVVALRSVCDWYKEGTDLPDLQNARMLLERRKSVA